MYEFAKDEPVDLVKLRERLRRMTIEELSKFGEAARNMCTVKANGGKPPREPFVIQLREARLEWKRRRYAR